LLSRLITLPPTPAIQSTDRVRSQSPRISTLWTTRAFLAQAVISSAAWLSPSETRVEAISMRSTSTSHSNMRASWSFSVGV